MSKDTTGSPWDTFGKGEGCENNLEPIPIKSDVNANVNVIEIQDHDVLSGRGKSNANHIGNVLFQAMIVENFDSYMSAPTQKAKKQACEVIMSMVRGRFLRFDADRSRWFESDDETVRTKVAQAFQYRQRRQAQVESTEKNNDEPKISRKRKLSSVSFIPEHSNVVTYPNMRIPQPLESDNEAVTLDELRWVLGSQSVPPPQQQQQQQHHHYLNSSTSVSNNFLSNNLPVNYSDDYAIGMPARMSAMPNKQLQQFVQPTPDSMSDFAERMRRHTIVLNAAAHEADSTANFLMQSHRPQQAHILRDQQLQPQQPAQFQNLNSRLRQPDRNIYNPCFPNTVGPTIHASQVMIPDSLHQQSALFQGTANHESLNVREFRTHETTWDAARSPHVSSFDFSPPAQTSVDFPLLERAAELYDSTQVQPQWQHIFLSMEENCRPAFQHSLSIDPLPLDENEIAQSCNDSDAASY